MSFFSTDTLSRSEHGKILKEQILPDKLGGLEPALRPKMFMLGGQPGAGKTKVREGITKQPQYAKALIVDPDELRTYHPRYVEFLKKDPDNAAGRVHPDASKWANELREAAMKIKLDIVLDTTLGGNPSSSVAYAKQAVKAGYDVEVHVAAVSMAASRQGVRARFEQGHIDYADDPENNLPPRSVPKEIQEASFRKIPIAIKGLAESGAVSRIRVANRAGETLSNVSGKRAVKKDGGKSSLDALKKERERAFTKQEIDAFARTNDEIAKNLQARIKEERNPQERKKLQQELGSFIDSGNKVVDDNIAILNGKLDKYQLWIKDYLSLDLDSETEINVDDGPVAYDSKGKGTDNGKATSDDDYDDESDDGGKGKARIKAKKLDESDGGPDGGADGGDSDSEDDTAKVRESVDDE